MTRTIRKLVFAMLSILLVLSMFLFIGTKPSFVKAQVENDTISTFDISAASIRTMEPTGIRFTTKVNKTYRDQILSGKSYEFGTLIIPVDIYNKSQQTELNHLVLDVMDVKQTVWGEEIDGYYAFNAVLMNLPSTEYGRELMARSYVKVDGGEPIYSATTITRTIAQVASTTIANYPEDENELLNTYVDAVAKSVSFNNETLELDVEQSANLSVTTDPANYDVIYSVDDESVISLLDRKGNIKGLKPGVATITATFGSHSDTIQVTVLEPTADWGKVEIAANNANLSINNGVYKLEVVTNPVLRLYHNDLSAFNAGDIVNVKITYKLTGASKDYCFYGPTATGALGLLPARNTLSSTGAEQSITITTIVSNTTGAVSTDNTSGSNKNNIALSLWVGANSIFELIDVEIIADSWGIVETVSGNATQTLENGNYKIVTTNNATYRLYVNALASYNAGDPVSVKITYKISDMKGGTQDLGIYAPNTASALGLVSARKTLVADGNTQSVTYNTVVSNTSGAMSATNTGGTNAKNIVLSPWIDTIGYTLEIINVTISPV